MKIQHKIQVEADGKYSVGNIVKFKYDVRGGERKSYSKIIHITPTILKNPLNNGDFNYITSLLYIMENSKAVPESDIVELVR